MNRPSTPWSPGYVLGWSGLASVGVVTMAVSWWGISGTTSLPSLITWLNVGIAGVTVAGVANMVWLLDGRRAVALRRTEVLRRLDAAAAAGPRSRTSDDLPAVLVSSPTMTRYHREECPAVQGKAVGDGTLDEHESAGRTACGMCLA